MKCPNRLCQVALDGDPAACRRCGLPLPGAMLGNRFQLERIERSTPVSVFYLAFDRERVSEAQIRVYTPRFGRNVSALKSEIKALKELRFEQLPCIYHFDWNTDLPWVAEERIAGKSMVGRLVGSEKPFAQPELIKVMLDVAKILEKIHTLHVYHRDIRPETLLIRDADASLVLGAPGWDLEFQDHDGRRNRSIYTAPEYVPGGASSQSDLYSLGVTALHLLTGLNPEGFYNAKTKLFDWQRAARTTPSFADILTSLVAPKPGDRIGSASRLIQLLWALEKEKESPEATVDQTAKSPESATPVSASGPLDASVKEDQGVGPAGALPESKRIPHHRQKSPRTGTKNDTAVATGRQQVGNEANPHVASGQVPQQNKARARAKKMTVAAAIAALLGGLIALWQRLLIVAPAAAVIQIHGIKILVVVGILGGAAMVANHLGSRSESSGQSSLQLPLPAVGYDDAGIPVQPDAHALRQAELGLQDPSLLSKWLKRRLAIAQGADLARQATAPEMDSRQQQGAGPGAVDAETVSLYHSIFPWKGEEFAFRRMVAAFPQLSGFSAAQIKAATTGLPSSFAGITRASRHPGATDDFQTASPMAEPSGAKGEMPSSLSAEPVSPFDAVAEPGNDPENASGLRLAPSPYFIRINKTYKTLTLYHNGQYAAQFPITVGKGANSPDGRYAVSNKVAKPSYDGIPAGDPRNPLGAYWLGLDVRYPGGRAIGIHGTNDPGAMGQAISGGCIRLRNEDVERLFQLVPAGTPVEVT